MVFSIDTALMAVLFILPAYFANATPVLLGGGTPVDLRRNFFDGKRLFGDGKTLRGFAAGIAAGALIAALEAYFLPGTQFAFLPSPQLILLSGWALSLGTMLGDLAGSFIKRRLGMDRGNPSLVLDQLFFLFVALAFAYPFAAGLITIESFVFLVALTYVLHVGTNFAANKLGLKSVPW